MISYNYFLFKPLLASTAVSDFLPGDFYIKTAEVEEQLIHKAAQPADVVRPLVLSISMHWTDFSQYFHGVQKKVGRLKTMIFH